MPEEILIKDGYFVRRTINEDRLMSQEDALRNALGATCVNVYNIALMGGEPIHGMFSDNGCFLYTRIRTLDYTTYFSCADGAENPVLFAPVYRASNVGSIELKATFKIPDAFPTFFGQYFNPGENSTYYQSNCYMLTTCPETGKEIYNFPYPNIFDDGRVCMGLEWDSQVSSQALSPLLPAFTNSFLSFNQTKMNNHLVKPATNRLFTYDIKKELFAANTMSTQQVLENLRICGNAIFQGIKLP